ncbi:MAG: fumarylacetoacetate hydrolase family protein [Acidobacteriota bacterium]|nr:fumarylacetoacetate hydrolase family protein [Acidobacteriota bacterium]MDE3043583.1 fumarylacetoacetate hydrolase family protein [Acidobacteriota bacterium]MDE3107370.1 fumarylacetoacetate hydrolase family protein [Acidobacteriota bacterium]MDE3222589.1 fumarylacetoacetate hydrolase family protein [Acidobacteriota bacterium]
MATFVEGTGTNVTYLTNTKGESVRFATIRTDRGPRLHVKGSNGYVDLGDASSNEALSSLQGLATSGDLGLEAARAASQREGTEFEAHQFAAATPDAPRVLCLGVNYAEHAIEGGREVPKWPESFVRGTGSMIGAFDDLVVPMLTERFDFEGELAVVIGKGGRYIREADAFDAILGYAVMNDGSAREWQRKATQWTPGKNFEGTMPIGPEVVTVDEVDITDVPIRSILNGEIMQDARTSMMIVSVARAVEYFSGFTTLRPGDVIATGTPGGVGFARTPPVWLRPGDVIEVEVEGVGKISNKVVAEQGAPSDWPWRPLEVDTTNF